MRYAAEKTIVDKQINAKSKKELLEKVREAIQELPELEQASISISGIVTIRVSNKKPKVTKKGSL